MRNQSAPPAGSNEGSPSPSVRAFYYDARGLDRELDPSDISEERLDDDTLLWVDVADRDAVDRIAGVLQFRNVSRCFSNEVRPALENHGDHFRFSVDTAPHREAPEDADADSGNQLVPGSVRVEFIVAHRWLVTIHEADVPCFDRFREQDKAQTAIGRLTGQSLAAALLDWHLGEYFEEVSRIETAVDRLDERVLRETTSKTLLGRMVALRRRVSKLRALLVSQRDIFYGLSRPDFVLVTDSGATSFYEALVGRYERAVDEVERCRDVVVGSFDLFTSRTSQQTNDLVKVLTFLTAIVGFCAAIAGLMGMNFKMQFFETGTFGFAIVTGCLIVVALGSVLFARHRKWI